MDVIRILAFVQSVNWLAKASSVCRYGEGIVQ